MRFTSLHNRNQIGLEKQKIVFQFSLVGVSSAIAGMLFIKILSMDCTAGILESMRRYFTESPSSASFGKQCLPDILCIAVLYIFSFSFINYIVTDFILMFSGFNFGICARLCFMSNSGYISWISVLTKTLILIVVLSYACKIAIQSLGLKKILSNGRVTIDSKVFASMSLSAISTVGATLIIHGLYCLL